MIRNRITLLCNTILVIALAIVVSTASAQTAATLAAKPPMGWNSWNHFAEKVTDADVRATADVLVSSGMRDAGYIYVNIDDTWEGQRDAAGNIHANSKFPDMKALGDYIHSRGLKFGIYSSPGPKTCAGFEGSYQHEDQDAATYASWGVDFLKYDLCGLRDVMDMKSPHYDRIKGQAVMVEAYARMHQSLLKTGRPIVYSICQYGMDSPWEWGAQVGGNLWRTTDDISDSFRSMALIGFSQAGLEKYAGPGHWNDPDMLEIGNGGMSADEYRTQMSLWAILAAPLLAGNDLSKMDDTTRSILMNAEVIAVDQDALGVQGFRLAPPQVWVRALSSGAKALAIFNYVTDDVPQPVTVTFKDLGLTGPVHARDLWAHKDLGLLRDSFTATPPKGGVVMLRLWQ